MSLIADSLKKAVKDKTVPQWEADPEVNPVAKREPIKRPGLATVFQILFLIVLPTGVLGYLIFIGAFDFKKTSVTDKPDAPVSTPVEEAKVAPSQRLAPEVSQGNPVELPKAKPKRKAPVEKKTVAQKIPDKALAGKQEKAPVKRVVPLKLPEEKPEKPKVAITETPATPDEKTAVLPSPDLKPASPVVAEILPVIKDLEKSAVAVNETPALKPPEVEIPDHEIATNPEPLAKPTLNQDLKKAKVSPEQKTPQKTETPGKPSVVPDLEKTKILPDKAGVAKVTKKKVGAVVPEETHAPKPLEVEVSGQKVVAQTKTSVQSPEKMIVKNETVPSPVPDAVKENPVKPAIEVAKKSPEVASLPASSSKPEISRIEPRDQENVFNNSDFYFNRGIFFQQAGNWQKALANYSKAEALDPNNPDTYNNKGVVLKEMGEFDKALDEFLRAVFLDAGYAKAYNNIGVVYYMQKNYSEAIRHYLKAIDINPTNLEAFNNLSIIYKKQNESDKARGVLNRALSLDPDHPGTNYNLAVLYEESSEIKPALYYYRRFIELGARNYPSLVIQVKEHLEGMKSQ